MTPAVITAIDAGALFALLDPPSENRPQTMANFARYIQAEKRRLIIPAPAVSEYLAYYAGEDEANRQMAVISKTLDIAPMDAQAAHLAAQIWFKVGARTFRSQMKELGFDISKQCVKVDLLIIASFGRLFFWLFCVDSICDVLTRHHMDFIGQLLVEVNDNCDVMSVRPLGSQEFAHDCFQRFDTHGLPKR
jgi:hypothetical protein